MGGMEKDMQNRMTAGVSTFRLPRYGQIPDIGLYLEQAVRYINAYLAPLELPELTGSMVSNYVKQRLIPGPEKKSYSRDSIAYLLLLSYIKTVMSLDDIRLMTQVQRRSYDLETAYDYFCAELENLLRYVCGVSAAPSEIGSTHTEEKELLRTALLSITYKLYMDLHLKFFREEETQPQT